MRVVRVSPKSKYGLFIPKEIQFDNGVVVDVNRNEIKSKELRNHLNIDLIVGENEWIYIDEGQPYKFDKSEEMGVRKNLFIRLLDRASEVPPSERIEWLYSMADILGLDLMGLLVYLNKFKKNDESISDAYLRSVQRKQ